MRWVTLRIYRNQGGVLKGQIAPGDAHPYLGLFDGQKYRRHKKVPYNIDMNIFCGEHSEPVVQHIKNKYGDELEFLWPRFSDNAVVRNKQNRKWYAVFLRISESKLGLKGDNKIEIIDLALPPEMISNLVDGEKFFEGYHMNKKHWLTIHLDGSVSATEICNLVDISYELSLKKK